MTLSVRIWHPGDKQAAEYEAERVEVLSIDGVRISGQPYSIVLEPLVEKEREP